MGNPRSLSRSQLYKRKYIRDVELWQKEIPENLLSNLHPRLVATRDLVRHGINKNSAMGLISYLSAAVLPGSSYEILCYSQNLHIPHC